MTETSTSRGGVKGNICFIPDFFPFYQSTECLHRRSPAGSDHRGRRGRALDGQHYGGSVSVTIPHDAYWSGTNLICGLFFPGLRTQHFAKPFNFWMNFQNWNWRNTYRNVLKIRGVHLNNASSFTMRTVIWFGMLIYLISTHIWAGGSVLHISRRRGERERKRASLRCTKSYLQTGERERGRRKSKGKGTSSSRLNKFVKHERKGFRFIEDICSVPVSG